MQPGIHAASTPRTPAQRLFIEGTSALNAGNATLAESTLRRAIKLAPGIAEAHANLALALERRNDISGAEACYRKSISLNPYIARTHLNLGAMLAAQKRFEEAEAAYLRCIMLDGSSPAAWSNIGVLMACLKREDEAEKCFRRAIALDPDYKLARFNFSYLLLRQGRFEEGWECFEARDWYADLAQRAGCPRWQGESLSGKSLLIGEQAGHGDMIQFARYAAVLKEQGATHITMLCHPVLHRLLESLPGVDRVACIDDPIAAGAFDYWTPLLSIPYRCATRLESIPARLPYLIAPPGRTQRWASVLPGEGLRVGLVWKGNPRFENDAERSLPSLDLLSPLAAIQGVQFISLQKHACEDDALRLIPLASMIDDFADSAAIIANLDLVISVDTAVAHLAGALAKPCWVLLPYFKTDWRWLVGRDDSPWYPSVMRLFRQPASGQWRPVIAEVAAALGALARS